MNARFPARQRGMTLLVALIMLVLMTLFAVSNFKMGNSSLQIVGNMQQRSQAMSAAQSTIEEVVSSTQFTGSPDAAISSPCGGTKNTRCFGVNGSTTNDITVTLKPIPECLASQTIQNATLDLNNANDAGCSTGVSQSFGIMGSASGASLCANTMWNVTAVAVDSLTKARATVVQGVSVRVTTESLGNTCQ
jgi:Tfp pilus assembly protein PilX